MALLTTPCPYLIRDDATHRYRGPDGLPVAISVTQVLAATDPPGKRDAINATRHLWEARGNACHEALELFVKSGRSWRPTPGDRFHDFIPWLLPLLSWPAWNAVTFTASELMLHDPHRDLSGTFDGAYRAPDGAHVLFDLKSRGQRHSGTYSTAAQLGGYLSLAAVHGLTFDRAATIWARPQRFPTVTLYSIADCLAAWATAWDAYTSTLPF